MTTFPKVLRRVEPQYTEEALRFKNEGVAVLLVQVDAVGRAAVKRLLRALGEWSGSAG